MITKSTVKSAWAEDTNFSPERINFLSRGITVVQLEFELTCYNVVVQHVSHCNRKSQTNTTTLQTK